ncbi:uroporphyrin-III C-methyltransferase [Beutenbergia cavernae DSM 12333]|uniref:Uroporphyrin-III C-methyltransferase n=1 Tax=Beutenbergia cavernae (strain ATCC BAA-8 / DSM 12333 / CCUG 43141 / JCM 11478 / NBRC 16432 / NCIMB 13614 / HKI 0122) TaxID=471853 RepID=C5BYE2_BEUC1|nr:uroporphyrinogen-III C-methyltransferase [Beutenbergia cavernae]ACQ81042.1 uroporphyrin-III C-methyltransferase [Beutenbergia cavernae DSM 12333]
MTTLLGLDVAGRTVLVAGGGPVAARRARALLDDGARVRLVAPEVCEDLAELVAAGTLDWSARDVAPADLDGAWLVLAATGSAAANRELAAWAEAARVWCVNAGAAHEGSARTPATTRSGDVLVGVVTDARAAAADPGRSRAVRDRIAATLADGVDQRRRRPGPGRVVLVGGGPGAVDLLTLRGRRELAQADVVVADRLGPRGVLAELPAGVEIVEVGKTPGHHPVPQHEINAILVERARRGQRVVRLKGGDPFVYGRGGEEVLACREAGVDVDVVPGVSSALAVPALAGIPLTHRGSVAALHVVTGHAGLDDVALACVRDRAATLVVLMGVSNLARIATEALAAGADAATPVAVVESGSTPQQRVTRGRLDDIADVARRARVRAPAVIVVGDVAAPGVLEAAS